ARAKEECIRPATLLVATRAEETGLIIIAGLGLPTRAEEAEILRLIGYVLDLVHLRLQHIALPIIAEFARRQRQTDDEAGIVGIIDIGAEVHMPLAIDP